MKSKRDHAAIRSSRLRLSPKGVLTLPSEALEMLNIPKDHSAEVGIDLRKENLVFYSPADKNKPRKRVSKGGQIQLSSSQSKLLKSFSHEQSGKFVTIESAKPDEVIIIPGKKSNG